MGVYGNCISGTKCSPGSVSYFFENISKVYIEPEIEGLEETKESSYEQEEKEDGMKKRKKKKKSKKKKSGKRRSRSRRK